MNDYLIKYTTSTGESITTTIHGDCKQTALATVEDCAEVLMFHII